MLEGASVKRLEMTRRQAFVVLVAVEPLAMVESLKVVLELVMEVITIFLSVEVFHVEHLSFHAGAKEACLRDTNCCK